MAIGGCELLLVLSMLIGIGIDRKRCERRLAAEEAERILQWTTDDRSCQPIGITGPSGKTGQPGPIGPTGVLGGPGIIGPTAKPWA